MARGYATDVEPVGGTSAVGGAYSSLTRASWGAIIAGVVIMIIVQLLLAVLGVGIGLSSIDPASAANNPDASSFSIGAAVYWGVSVIISTYLGAYFAGRLAGVPNRTDGMLHGIVAWATATLLIIYVLTSSATSLVGGLFGTFGSALQTVGQSVQGGASGLLQVLPGDLRAQAEGLFKQGAQQAQGQAQATNQQAQQATGTASTPDMLRKVVAGVRDGASPQDRQAAVNLIAQQAGIPPEEADKRLGDFQNTYRQTVAQTQDQVKQAAIESRETVSRSAYVLAGALLIGLLVAAIGGRAGAPEDEYVA
jgi:hypothetical protein